MSKTVKVYQTNTINLLTQFDTKHDAPCADTYELQYCIGKEGNELYISIDTPQDYNGKLTVEDFCFSTTTHRLFMYIRELYSLRGTADLDFSVKDFMQRCGLKDRKQGRKQIERDLFAMLAVVYYNSHGSSAILDGYEMHHGRVYVHLSQGFVAEMEKENYILLPIEYFTIDRQKYSAAPGLLYYLVLLKYMNSGKSNRNRISIKSLLAHGRFPTIKEVRATRNNSIKGRIVDPLFRNLNALSQVAKFKYYDERGNKLTAQEVQALRYDDLIRVVVHIEWLYDKK